jgi:DNA-binding transcriptional ArsR family regulator
MDQILKRSPKIIEMEMTELLIDIKNADLSYSTVSVHLASLNSYFCINDIVLTRKKLSKFVGEQENKYNIANILTMKFRGSFITR